MDLVSLLGLVGAAASVASFTPQAWKVIRARNTKGLSAGMYGLTVLAFAAWAGFGWLHGKWEMVVPNLVCLLFAVFIWAMILLPPRATARVARTLDPSADDTPGD